METIKNLENLRVPLLVLSLLLFSILTIISELNVLSDDISPKKDRFQYMRMGYNLAHYGTLSLSTDDEPNPKPTNYRSPAYPTILAAIIKFNPSLYQLKLEDYRTPEKLKFLRPIKHVQIVLLLVAYLSVIGLVFLTTDSLLFTLAAQGTLFAYSPIHRLPNGFYAENLICCVLPLASFFLCLAFKKKQLKFFILAGISLGLLCLTRSPFLYSVPPILLFYFWVAKGEGLKEYFAQMSVLVLCFSAVVLPWMLRNNAHFSKMSIIDGKNGRILAIRAFSFNTMTFEEWKASFFAWNTSGDFRKWGNTIVAPGSLERFDTRNPKGFRKAGRAMIGELKPRGMNSRDADRALKKMALKEIVSKPLNHLAVTIALMHRGMIVSNQHIYNVSIYLSLFAVFLLSLLLRNSVLFGATVLPMFSHTIFASLSHFNTRYSKPTHTLALICAVILSQLICLAALRLFRRFRGTEREAIKA